MHVEPHIEVKQHCLNIGQSAVERQLRGLRQLTRASGLAGVGQPPGFTSEK